MARGGNATVKNIPVEADVRIRSRADLVDPSLVTLPAARPSRIWLWFVAAFVVQVAVWTAWLTIAAHHQVQEVPLASTSP